jgi:histidinol-phosphate aminotransferase
MLRTVADIARQRDRIVAALPTLGYAPHPTWANFVLFGGVSDPGRAWQDLYDRGVLVRDIGMPGHLRVSAGTAAETDAFLAAMASIDSAA